MITVDDIASKKEYFYKSFPNSDAHADFSPVIVSQGKFLRELHPESHLIFDPLWYSDLVKKVPIDPKDPNSEMTDGIVKVARVGIPIQKVMLFKQLSQMTGKPMNFDIMETDPTDSQMTAYVKLKQKWVYYQFDTSMYEFFKSVLATGDGAHLTYKDENGETSYKVFSILNRDHLHPIFDYSGKLRLFGRSFVNCDQGANNESVSYLEVWDDTYYYLFTNSEDVAGDDVQKSPCWDDTNDFKLSAADDNMDDKSASWYLMSQQEHGFKEIPVVYCKNEAGACWSDVQPLINDLEVALSELFENNKTYAFRIMYIQGGFEIQGDMKDNAVQPRAIILSDPNAKVGTVEGADASNSFNAQLDHTINLLKVCGFIVTPPTTISGDVSGTAIKILYSPAIEKAQNDIHFFNPSIRQITNRFKESISTEDDVSPSDMNKLHVRAYCTPYVPQNDTDTVNNLTVAKGSGYLSSETCQEKDPNASPQEAMRIKQEEQEKAIQERNAIVGQSQDTGGTAIIDAKSNKGASAMNPQNTQKKALSKVNGK